MMVVVVVVGVGGGRRLTLWVCGPRNVSYIQQTIGQQFYWLFVKLKAKTCSLSIVYHVQSEGCVQTI